MGRFATGVTVVSARGICWEPLGTTANAVTSLSLEPPMVLVCLQRSSATLAALRRAGFFGLNVLAADQRDVSETFARPGARTNVWKEIEAPEGRLGVPLVAGALATVECTVEDVLAGGDHEIVLGHVAAADCRAPDAAPLVFFGGSYSRLPEGTAA